MFVVCQSVFERMLNLSYPIVMQVPLICSRPWRYINLLTYLLLTGRRNELLIDRLIANTGNGKRERDAR